MEQVISSLPVSLGVATPFVAAQLWFTWYLLTKTIPAMLVVFSEEIGKERAEAKEDRDSCERRHRELLELSRSQHREIMVEMKGQRHAAQPRVAQGKQSTPPANPGDTHP